MQASTDYVLLSTAIATGVFHTVIPDHWLPFVLIGRARGWSIGRTAGVSAFSALVHVTISSLIGLFALAAGLFAADLVGETLHRAGAILLIVFGLLYAIWAWRKGGHFHPGGAWLHSRAGTPSCAGDEGNDNPEHLHYHADDELIRGRSRWSALWLAVLIGANPCILLVPIMTSAAGQGPGFVSLVVLTYSLPCIALVVGLSVLGVVGARRIRLPGAARHMEMISGLIIAALGFVLWFRH